jgi:predicted ArsR family transcriptional regulator
MGAKGEKPRESKKAQLIRLLSAKTSADVGAISAKLGWLPHTTRAAISGLKKAGYEVTTQKPDPEKPTRYRITAKPKVAVVADTAPEPAHAG